MPQTISQLLIRARIQYPGNGKYRAKQTKPPGKHPAAVKIARQNGNYGVLHAERVLGRHKKIPQRGRVEAHYEPGYPLDCSVDFSLIATLIGSGARRPVQNVIYGPGGTLRAAHGQQNAGRKDRVDKCV